MQQRDDRAAALKVTCEFKKRARRAQGELSKTQQGYKLKSVRGFKLVRGGEGREGARTCSEDTASCSSSAATVAARSDGEFLVAPIPAAADTLRVSHRARSASSFLGTIKKSRGKDISGSTCTREVKYVASNSSDSTAARPLPSKSASSSGEPIIEQSQRETPSSTSVTTIHSKQVIWLVQYRSQFGHTAHLLARAVPCD